MSAIFYAVWLSACTADKGDTDTAGPTDSQPPLLVFPTLRTVVPKEGATLEGGEVELILDIRDFRLEPPEEEARRRPLPLPLLMVPSAWAHGDPSDPSGYIRITLDGVELVLLTEPITTLKGIAVGEHTLEVELLWADGDALYPPVEDEVSFVMQ